MRLDPRLLPEPGRWRWLLAAVGAGVAPFVSAAEAEAVTIEQARAALESGRAVLIDIREPAEHATGVAPGARLLPLRQMDKRLGEIPTDPAQPVLLICQEQARSSRLFKALRDRGYGHVRFVQGGMSEWARRGWPMVAPSK